MEVEHFYNWLEGRWQAKKPKEPIDLTSEFICGTVAEMQAAQSRYRERIRLAIRAEIRERGRVNSIAPAEIEKLIETHSVKTGRD